MKMSAPSALVASCALRLLRSFSDAQRPYAREPPAIETTTTSAPSSARKSRMLTSILCVISLNVMSTVPTIGFRPVFSE